MIRGRGRGGALAFLVALDLLLTLPSAFSQDPAAAPPAGQQEGPATPPPPRRPPRAALPVEELARFLSEVRAAQTSVEQLPNGDLAVFWNGGVSAGFPWRQEDGSVAQVRLQADRVMVNASPAQGAAQGEPGGARPGEGEKAAGRESGRFSLGPPRLYAEGNVRLAGKGMVLETDAFFYDDARKRGVAVGVRGHADLDPLLRRKRFDRQELSFLRTGPIGDFPREEEPGESESGGDPAVPKTGARPLRVRRVMAMRAEVLRAFDLQHFEGEGMVISACEYGVPHFAVRSGAAKVYPAAPPPAGESPPAGEPPPPPAPGAEPGEKEKQYLITSEGNRIAVQGIPVLPLPPLRWNTAWGTEPPVRVTPGQSSKFGFRLDADTNVNWLLNQTPLTRLEPARLFLDPDWSRLSFATDYRSKRGFGWGPEAMYGPDPKRWEPGELKPETWIHHGESGYYAIRDHGEDRTSAVQFEDPDRYWGHVAHRQSIPYVGVLDVEYSSQSDPNFLNEYFEPVAKEEKEQESLFYLRRQFRDNLAVTGLYKYRTNDFETVTERAEGKAFVLEQPIARTGIYSGLELQGANLHERFNDSLGLPDQRSSRFDALNEWSYPFGLGPQGRLLRLRPFADVRASVFENGVDPADEDIHREALGAGISASQEWSRIYAFPRGGLTERLFDFTRMKHLIVPKVTYRNLYYNNVESSRLIPFDEVEEVSTDERIQLSLRNDLLVRGPRDPPPPPEGPFPEPSTHPVLQRLTGGTHRFLETRLSMDWFTHPGRDNGGNRFSTFDVDVTFRPSRRFWLYTRTSFDPNEDLRFQQTDSGVTVVPVADTLYVTVGERFTRDLTSFTYTSVTMQFSPKYLLDVYYAYDFELQRQSEIQFRMIRIADEWAIEFVYGLDVGEDNNQSFTVNVQPMWLISSLERRRERAFAMGR